MIDARLYTLPPERPQLYVVAAGSQAAKLAGRLADGLISTAPKRELVSAFGGSGGAGRPRVGQVTVCWAPDEEDARRTASTLWPSGALGGSLNQELPTPEQFEAAVELVTEGDVADTVVCGPDPDRLLEAIRRFKAAGFDHVHGHQVGPDQDGFMCFYQTEIIPQVTGAATAA